VADTALPEIKREYSYAFDEHPYPGAPTYDIRRLDETPFDFGDLHIIPIKLKHFTLTCYAFRIGNFAYVTDLSEISEEAIEKLQGVEYLIIEALQKKKHYSHLTLDEAVEISKRVGAKKTWFTHCSHSMGLAADINRTLPEGMMLAYDGLKIRI
jgi:phosphoribosyl 1,2-cyclic phosphate phosphodiesterase